MLFLNSPLFSVSVVKYKCPITSHVKLLNNPYRTANIIMLFKSWPCRKTHQTILGNFLTLFFENTWIMSTFEFLCSHISYSCAYPPKYPPSRDLSRTPKVDIFSVWHFTISQCWPISDFAHPYDRISFSIWYNKFFIWKIYIL